MRPALRTGSLRLRLALLLLAWLFASPPLGATCSCTISASVSEPTLQLSGTSTGACVWFPAIEFYVDGGFFSNRNCDGTSASCSHSSTKSSACLRTGMHTATAVCNCGNFFPNAQGEPVCLGDTGRASTTFSVNTTPTVSVSYDGPDAQGSGTLSVPFSFPNTATSGEREVAVFSDGSSVVFARPEEASGVQRQTLDTNCWRQGTHQLQAVAVACGKGGDDAYRADTQTTVMVDHTPQVSLSLSADLATVTYAFPQTRTSGERLLTLWGFPEGSALASFRPEPREGTWSALVSCAQGARRVVMVTADACQDTRKLAVAALTGCPKPPRKDGCEDQDGRCESCTGPGGGGPVGGGGPGLGGKSGPPILGPGARLYYLAGGAGSPGNPGREVWNAALGRGWSHDYAERIVPGTGGRAWLITRSASFREYTDANGDGLYEKVSPEDEYRTLARAATGWGLHDLDGTVTAFDASGLWVSTTDRNGNAKTATYAGGWLTAVAMPDGRSETFSYHPSGKLAAITEVGVGGTARTWTFTWSGDDLVSIEAPDGTGQRFVYSDSRHPGYITRRLLLGADDGDPATPRPERVEAAWEYDGEGNVVRAWRGAETFEAGVERHELAYNTPIEPTQTTVTIHRSASEREVVRYTLSRTASWAGAKPRVTSISGNCSSCGLAPDSQLFYDDPAHPLLPTRIVDGRGTETRLRYDARGRVIERTEAANTPLARTTTWAYDSTFPALPLQIEAPSTSGGAAQRATRLAYDAAGNLTSRRIQGVEAGGFFDLETVTTFNAAGQPLTVDPPGYGGEDRTSFTYDPARGGLVPLARTDPLVGATTFEHDAFNRRTATVDPNGVRTETTYDALGRVLTVTQKGVTAAEDLVTTYTYNAFGDLLRTTLPRGNVVEYGYDAPGRLISTERKPDTATPSERTLYTLDLAGNRTREELQRWDGAAWVTESFTDFTYLNRCQIGKVVHAGGAVTEYAYDCDGNLEKVWDANHPRQGSSGGEGGEDGDCDEPPCGPPGEGANAPTQVYQYDALDRLIRVRQPWAGGGEEVTSYAYDVQDHLTAVTDAEGNTTTYTYSDRDLITQEVSPVSGTTTQAYNEHGELVAESDARGITVTRAVDALDRVTLIDYADDTLDITYTYDDPTVPFSRGRLTKVTRSGSGIAYAYDRFGRVTQDGELTYGYDANGNRAEIGYPGGVIARYSHDFADREISLEVRVGGAAPQAIVSGATYKASGPLSAFTFGNGLAEIRSFDQRYFPSRIEAPGRLDQIYTTDAVGNILSLNRAVGPDRFFMTFAYQDPQYFLTEGNGPWGRRAWSYDRIGNRLSETPPSDLDPPVEIFTYSYLPNSSGGNNPKLSRIEPAPGGEPGSHLDFGYDAAGNQTRVTAVTGEESGRTSFLDYSAESRLSQLRTSNGPSSTELLYDGRGFLRRSRLTATNTSDFEQTEPVYNSEGLLLARRYHKQSTHGGRGDAGAPPTSRVVMETAYIFYFAGRPMAQLTRPQAGGGADKLLFFTTDHLGTPILATDAAGAVIWEGGLDPFGTPFVFPAPRPPGEGEDPQEPPEGGDQGTSTSGTATMGSAGIFLRFPGQWDDPSFRSHGLPGGLYYNVHRYYMPGTGRYGQPDPLGIGEFDPHLYVYVNSNPLRLSDPLGLRSWPFGAGRFCRDTSCRCEPPVRILGENQNAFVPTPGPGQCVDADAVYSIQCVVKIPDNISCTLKCDPTAPRGQQGGILECRPKGLILGRIAVALGKQPECFTKPEQIPRGWPPNPLWSGGS